MKTGIIIQTRMGSSRLPGKVMKNLCGKPVISHVIERVKQCVNADDIIIATTTHDNDTVISEQAEKNGVKCFRGSEEDVLSRYYFAAIENNLDIIVRITSDCPLIDPKVTDEVIEYYKNNSYDIVSNTGSELKQRTFPRGLDTEVFSFDMLKSAFQKATEKYQREHVTPYIYERSERKYIYKNDNDYSKYRWTLDTEEDLFLIEQVYKNLYSGKHDFFMQDIIDLFIRKPDLITINQHVEQKKMKG